MRTYFFRCISLLIMGGVILSACNMPGGSAVAETLPSATNTTAPIPSTSTPTEVPPTETPTVTPTETLTPEPSATSTPEIPKAVVNRQTNCRVGPAGNYDRVAVYEAGQKLEVVAQDLGNGFLVVKNPDKPEEQCYLPASNITVTGDTSALPKFTPQPSPTLMPYFNATFKKYNTCKGEDYAVFVVENVGSVPFRSAYIKVTNPKVGKSVEESLNAFDLHVGCVLARDIYPLDPGATGYVNSPPLKFSKTGNGLSVFIMLCTEKFLKGVCPTQSMLLK